MKPSAVTLLQRAHRRCRIGDLAGAIADLGRAIDLEPSLATAYFARGDVKRVAGDLAGAIEDLTVAIRLRPDLALAYVSRGNAHRNRGDTKTALADLDAAIRLDPKCATAYAARAMARREAGKADAIRDFNQAIRLDPAASEAFFGRGWARLSAADPEGAISDFTRVLELNPQHAVAFMLRGEAHRERGASDQAIADLTQAIELGVPDWGNAVGQRGVERLKTGDAKGALADLTQAIESLARNQPSPATADAKLAALYLARGTALLALAEPRRAIADLTTAVEMDPALQNLARPLLNQARQQLPKAQAPKAGSASSGTRGSKHASASDFSTFAQWEKHFRAQARADNYGQFQELLEQLEVETFTPKQMLEGTIELVRCTLAYSAGLDGRPILPFLQMQTYDPRQSTSARYILVFDIHQVGCGRLLDDADLRQVDLADLYGQPIEKYRRVGFSDLWILRADGAALRPSERRRLKRLVRGDLFFDYEADEIDVDISSPCSGQMLVQVRDHVEEEDR